MADSSRYIPVTIRHDPSQSIETSLFRLTVIDLGIVANANKAVKPAKIPPMWKYHRDAVTGKEPATINPPKKPSGANPE